jgi:molybdate transport system permease protein
LNFWLTEAEWRAVHLSLLVGAVAVAASLPFAVAIGWSLARFDFRGKAFVEAFLNLPLVLPPVVTGYVLLVVLGTQGVIGNLLYSTFGLRLVFDWKGAAVASAVISFPLMVRSLRVAFTSVDPGLEQAARTLGAGPLDTFFTVSLPLSWHGVIAGCILAFARSIGEFGATIMIAGNMPGRTQTIPLYVFSAIESPQGMAAAQRIVVVSIVIAVAALLAGEWFERRTRAARRRAKVS